MSLCTALARARTFTSTYGVRALAREVFGRARHGLLHPGMPARFHVEISNTCNFNCEYCVLRAEATGDAVMTEATFEAILPHLRGASSVALSGLAEPLMNRRFPEYLARVRAVAPRALISIDTNASLLTEPLAEAMVAARLDSLVFSLDGVDAGLVDGIRQGGSLNEVLDRIRMLGEVKRRLGSEVPAVAATFVAQRKNVAQLPAVVRLASSLGVAVLSVNGLEPYEADLADEALWARPGGHAPEAAAAVAEAGRVADELGVELRLPSPVPMSARCTLVGRPVILADGTVVPCSVLAYRRERFLGVGSDGTITGLDADTERLAFGNVNERPLGDIWKDPAYAEFRSRVLRSHFPAECALCLMKHDIICANEPVSAERFAAELAAAAEGTS